MAKKKKPKHREPEPAATEQPLIFLDIDGVICCNRVGELEASKLAQLQRICRETGAKVVLSTDWRRQAALKRQVIQALARLDMECVGATPQRSPEPHW